jgi:sialate O-acetylesterase
MIKNISIAFCLLFCEVLMLNAQVKLPFVINDNMVLQQQTNVALWGKAVPNKTVVVKTSWNNKEYTVKVQPDSIWRIKVSTPTASYKAYSISFTCETRKTINNVLIGEVWLCGGQSNMYMKMNGFSNQPVEGSFNEILNSENNYLRCYTSEVTRNVKLQYDCKGAWATAGPNSTGNFSATAYYYGKMLQNILHIPIGLVSCSVGGSGIETWMSPKALTPFKDKIIPLTPEDDKKNNMVPTVFYNGMLNAIAGFGIRGAIWYQGEANKFNPKEYIQLFAAMHKDWIENWKIGTFPIYFCQLAPYEYGANVNCAFMREAQSFIANNQPNTAMAVLSDTGEENCIHPSNKKVAGERLAVIALEKNYGYNKIPCQSPEYLSVEFKEERAFLKFKNAPLGTTPYLKEFDGFELAGADRKFYPAKAITDKAGFLSVSSEQVKEPIAVRYGFKNYFKGNLFGTNGLPVSSFRSDNWDDVQ